MTSYENLVISTQRNYSRYYGLYASGRTPYRLSKKKMGYEDEIKILLDKINNADCIVVGAASGLSAAGGGDFYYSNNDSYKKYFGPFEKKYHFNGAFDGMTHNFEDRAEYWGYLSTFLHTTLNAPLREPYKDLDALIRDKDFFILTTNQDTQFIKLYSEDKVAEIQGDHRFFQCSSCCSDYTWLSVDTINKLYASLNGGTKVDPNLIPHCPHCGAEAFPWVRGYGNFLEGEKYQEEYQKISSYIESHQDKNILFLELGVGRLTPMFIQEPFWNLTYSLPSSYYIAINDRYDYLPIEIEEKGIVIVSDIAKVLKDAVKLKREN